MWLEIFWVIFAVDNSFWQSGSSDGTYLTEKLENLHQEAQCTSKRISYHTCWQLKCFLIHLKDSEYEEAGRREESGRDQSSASHLKTHLARGSNATLIAWMAKIGRWIDGDNGSDDCVSGRKWL